MFSNRVKTVVDQASPRDEIALIVSVSARPDMDEVRRIPTLTERRQFVNQFYSHVKAPVFESVSTLSSEGVRIIDPLHGTPQIIIAGPARTWRRILDQEVSLLHRPDVVVTANEPEWSLP